MWLAEVLADVLSDLSYPGRTSFSVTVAAECTHDAETCEDAKRSTFYGAWVRQETYEEAQLRYAVIASALEKAAQNVLCRTADDVVIDGCKPYATGFKKQSWGVMYLTLAAIGAATYESGFREDVQVGRGHAKKPSDDGGRGRGPGGESCLMQVHPQSAWAFVPNVGAELYARAKNGDREAREAIAVTLVGLDESSLVLCFETGMRMLVRSRAYCEWASPKTDPRWAMYAQYGTGTSCTSPNDGKTALRQRLYESLIVKVKARRPRSSLNAVEKTSDLVLLQETGGGDQVLKLRGNPLEGYAGVHVVRGDHPGLLRDESARQPLACRRRRLVVGTVARLG